MIGGIYSILEIINKLVKNINEETITTKELSQLTGLSEQSIGRNLNKLVKQKLLIRIESRQKQPGSNKECRSVEYKINGDTHEFINSLFK